MFLIESAQPGMYMSVALKSGVIVEGIVREIVYSETYGDRIQIGRKIVFIDKIEYYLDNGKAGVSEEEISVEDMACCACGCNK